MMLLASLMPQVAFASGSDGRNVFTDIEDQVNGLVNENRPWFTDAAINMYYAGIVKGYDDGSFRGGNTVTRAELVTMLDRLLSNIRDVYHQDWIRFETAYYSVWSPILGNSSRVEDADGCSSFLDGITDRAYPVFCHSGGEKGMELAISEMGSQFVENDRRRESRWEFMLNGHKAVRVVVTAFQEPRWYYESIFVLDEDTGRVFQISNGANRDPNFENFYLSFTLR